MEDYILTVNTCTLLCTSIQSPQRPRKEYTPTHSPTLFWNCTNLGFQSQYKAHEEQDRVKEGLIPLSLGDLVFLDCRVARVVPATQIIRVKVARGASANINSQKRGQNAETSDL